MSEPTPEDRALAAAEFLAAEGARVTARSIQQRAQVGMNVAAAAAREWNARQSAAQDVPPVPEALVLRFQALWAEANKEALARHQLESDGWAARLKAAEEERDQALDEITRAEEAAGELAAQVAALEAELEQVHATIADANARVAEAATKASAADARAAAAEGVAEGLRQALAALTPAKKS